MILRDVYCLRCGCVLEDAYVERGQSTVTADCPSCGELATFAPVCNGGLRSRYRCNDWPTDPEFYKGQIKCLGVDATDSNGEPVRKYTSGTRAIGAPMHDNVKYKNESAPREDRRDRIVHATRRKRGRLPIVVDLARK